MFAACETDCLNSVDRVVTGDSLGASNGGLKKFRLRPSNRLKLFQDRLDIMDWDVWDQRRATAWSSLGFGDISQEQTASWRDDPYFRSRSNNVPWKAGR